MVNAMIGLLTMRLDGGRPRAVRELARGQRDGVRRGVLFEARDPLGAGHRSNVVVLCEKPRERDLRRRRAGLLRDRLDLVQDPQVLIEVAADEPENAHPVVLCAQPAGQKPSAERRRRPRSRCRV